MIPLNAKMEKIENEYEKVDKCVAKLWPVVSFMLESTFKEIGVEFKRMGKGINAKYEFKKKACPPTVSMFMGSLFLDIVTVDRDKKPLTYDTRCDDPQFLFRRITDVIESKLARLLPLIAGKNIDEVEKLARQMYPNYERFNAKILK
jgi:hypothetical protein